MYVITYVCQIKHCKQRQQLFTYHLRSTPPGPCLNIKTVIPRFRDSHVKDNTVARPSYLLHGDRFSG